MFLKLFCASLSVMIQYLAEIRGHGARNQSHTGRREMTFVEVISNANWEEKIKLGWPEEYKCFRKWIDYSTIFFDFYFIVRMVRVWALGLLV